MLDISKEYGVTPDDIRAANPTMDLGVRATVPILVSSLRVTRKGTMEPHILNNGHFVLLEFDLPQRKICMWDSIRNAKKVGP